MTELGRGVRRIWDDGRRIEKVAYVVAGVLFVSGLVHVVVLLVTGRTWIGPLSLRKAATFGLSFGLTLASVAWAPAGMAVRKAAANAASDALERLSLINEHDGNVVPDCVAERTRRAHEAGFGLAILELAVTFRTDQNLEELRVEAHLLWSFAMW